MDSLSALRLNNNIAGNIADFIDVAFLLIGSICRLWIEWVIYAVYGIDRVRRVRRGLFIIEIVCICLLSGVAGFGNSLAEQVFIFRI